MGEDMPNEYPARLIIYRDNETVCVPLDIEDGIPLNRIRAGIGLTHIGQAPPLRSLGGTEPCIERTRQVGMRCSGFRELLATDNVHSINLPHSGSNVRILRTFCQGGCVRHSTELETGEPDDAKGFCRKFSRL